VHAVAEAALVRHDAAPAVADAAGDIAARREADDLHQRRPDRGDVSATVDDRPTPGHGDTALSPIAEPKVKRTSEIAAAQSAPAMMAPQFR
jgi:hypothetical protein